ncbi:hypothetical protein DZB84_05545 [Bacillus sp. HNG]|uniref:hypothetical protein n=1 Tax=Bacillus sp. HNG TaxID=2293325 RepID=UPI000E2F8313|nr:hypothetical protein [Bacillus sp. HNG]RFB18374.1 hypothetical protein DZB84_05545 [Bacillus sp. HNG]
MKFIASHSYIVIQRKIEWNEQKYIETHHQLRLFEDRILSSANEFQLEHVYDVSFRTSFLYLHTNQGVFSYLIKEDPIEFIQAFKGLKQ